jgi:hypothetical protein
MYVTKPCKFIGFGAMYVTKPYEFIGFGAMYPVFPRALLGKQALSQHGPDKRGVQALRSTSNNITLWNHDVV